MKTKYLIAIPALFLAAQSFAHKVDVSPDVHHRNSDIKYDHAEQFNYNGVQCIAVFLPIKKTDGVLVTQKSINCQE
jgi:hypothetical protein